MDIIRNEVSAGCVSGITNIELVTWLPQQTVYVYQEVSVPSMISINVTTPHRRPAPRIITVQTDSPKLKCIIQSICGDLRTSTLDGGETYEGCRACVIQYLKSFPDGFYCSDIAKDKCGCNPKVPIKPIEPPYVKQPMVIKLK